jgi:hypothetical protein
MPTCAQCGGEIIFRHLNGVVTPIHLSGFCAAETDYRVYEHAEDCCRQTSCPKCGALVYFVRHNGGSVWFDHLGLPWPKHPCLDDGGFSFDPLTKETESRSFLRPALMSGVVTRAFQLSTGDLLVRVTLLERSLVDRAWIVREPCETEALLGAFVSISLDDRNLHFWTRGSFQVAEASKTQSEFILGRKETEAEIKRTAKIARVILDEQKKLAKKGALGLDWGLSPLQYVQKHMSHVQVDRVTVFLAELLLRVGEETFEQTSIKDLKFLARVLSRKGDLSFRYAVYDVIQAAKAGDWPKVRSIDSRMFQKQDGHWSFKRDDRRPLS